jgi:hypothetical protein
VPLGQWPLTAWPLNMKAPRTFETSGTSQRHVVTSQKTWI